MTKVKAVVRAVTALIAATAVALPATPARADSIRNNQWHLKALNVATAHRISQGEGVTVAVIDSGVDPHPDLRKNLLPGTDLVHGGTGDGRADTDGHGTSMACLIAAHGRSASSGLLGIAPKAKILPIRISAPARSLDYEKVAQAIRYAVEHRVDVINVSIAGSAYPELSQAVDAALAAGIVVVAGAGNRPRDVVVGFPAFYDSVLAVGASDRQNARSSISVTGDRLDILAPGVDIQTAGPGGRYRTARGTSDSTAIVSGAVALVRSKYPELSPAEVVHRLTATATDRGPAGRDPQYGYGVLNLVAALTADVPPLAASASPSADTGASPASPSPGASASPAPYSDGGSSAGTGAVLLVGLLVVIVGGSAAWFVLRRRQRPSRNVPPAPAGAPPGWGQGRFPGSPGHPQGAPPQGYSPQGYPPGAGPAGPVSGEGPAGNPPGRPGPAGTGGQPGPPGK